MFNIISYLYIKTFFVSSSIYYLQFIANYLLFGIFIYLFELYFI